MFETMFKSSVFSLSCRILIPFLLLCSVKIVSVNLKMWRKTTRDKMQYANLWLQLMHDAFLELPGNKTSSPCYFSQGSERGSGAKEQARLKTLEIVDLLDISRDTLSKVGRAITVTNNWHSFTVATHITLHHCNFRMTESSWGRWGNNISSPWQQVN